MVEYSRNIGRLMVAWRWVLFVFIALELLNTSETYPSLAKYAPAAGINTTIHIGTSAAIGLLAVWFSIATVLQMVMTSNLRTVIVSIADILVGMFILYGQRSIFGALMLGLPVVEAFTIGSFVGYGTAAVLLVLYPILRLIDASSHAGLHTLYQFSVIWYYPYIAFAVVSGSLFQALLRQELQARALVSVIETSQELGSSADLEKILSLVVKEIKALFGCSTCVVYLKEDNPTEPMIRVAGASSPTPEAFSDFNPEQAQGIVSQVIKDKKGKVLDDFQHYQPEGVIRKEGVLRATMVAPLMFEEDAIGAIFVSHVNPAVYNDSLFRLFAMLANQVALAVRNVQLHKTTATLAITDSLSGLFTHGYFQEHLGKEVIASKYSKQGLSLMIIDVDFFKKVNDTYGHPQGDALLKQLGGVIKQVTRPTDVVCRYGGDEFTVTMLNTNRISAVVIAERIRQMVEDYEFVLGNQIVHVTISGGVASFPEDAETKKELIDKADHAMYESKHKGRNRICFSA